MKPSAGEVVGAKSTTVIVYKYFLSAIVILAITCGGLYVLQQSLRTATDTGSEINLVGRQRYLGERLLKEVQAYQQETDPEKLKNLRRAILESLHLSRRGFLEFIDRSSMAHQRDVYTEDIRLQANGLRPLHQEIVERVEAFMESNSISHAEMVKFVSTVNHFTLRINALIDEMEVQAQANADQLVRLARWLILLLIVAVLVQAFFIFAPAIGELRKRFKRQELLLEELQRKTEILAKKESEARLLSNVASRTINGAVITDAEGRVEWVNDGFTRISGYTLADMKGKKPGSVLQCPETDMVSKEYMSRQVREGKPFQSELWNKRKNGELYWVHLDVQPVFDESGVLTGFIGLETDLTDRRKTELELARVNNFQRIILDNTAYAIVGVGTDGIIQMCNPAAEQILGWSASELVGKLTPFVFHDEEEIAKRMSQFSRELGVELKTPLEMFVIKSLRKLPNTHDWTYIRRDGTRFVGSLTVSLLRDANGEITGYIGSLVDMTKQREAQETLSLARDAAEAAARAKSDFLANMSHEIRTPLNAIIGMTGLLMESPLTEEQRDHAETVRTSGEALLSLINDILDFSKIDAGQLEFEAIDFDVRSCVEEVGDLLSQKAYEKRIELALLVNHDVPRRVVGDPGRLRQVLLNLTSNAVKFTERGEVVITVSCKGISDGVADIHFEVADTGIGIPAHRKDRLFKSFSQVDSSTTRRFGGTGLGLAISRQLVEIMGGTLDVDSRLGYGSKFWFRVKFPLSVSDQELRPMPHEVIKGIKILIVDDNQTNRRVIREQLKSWECDIQEAASGPEALELLCGEENIPNQYRIVLVDYQMPGMSGDELARAIRTDRALRELPLIMLTSAPRKGDTEAMKLAGFEAYLSKPVKQSNLLDVIAVTLGLDHSPKPREKRPLITQEVLEELRQSKIRILLVEDNPVNQKVASRLLEKVGLRCDIASNGLEAVNAMTSVSYDLILMDCQMPEMDGYEATKYIRHMEGDASRTPIVAMTAEALEGDRQRCLDSGMNDYLSKPIEPNKLYEVISNYLPKHNVQSEKSAPRSAPLDESALVRQTKGNNEIRVELIRLFIENLEESIVAMENNFHDGTNASLAAIAVSLRGTATNIGAGQLAAYCSKLEVALREGEFSFARELFEKVKEEKCRIVAHFEESIRTSK